MNNYNPGYFGNGNNAYIDQNPANTPFTIPPSSTPSIGDDMIAHNISWKYYGDQWNNYVNDPYQLNYGAIGANSDEYCNICNPFQYDTSIMANAAVRTAHIQDTANLYSDIANGTLPAVSIVKPSGLVDGHPSSSKLDLFEGFTQKIIDAVQANPALWKDTAIFITEDEGGGYYDSGYVQPLDFFGDGTRIPLIVVSPYTKAGTHLAQLFGPCLDPQIHRAELGSSDGHHAAAGTISLTRSRSRATHTCPSTARPLATCSTCSTSARRGNGNSFGNGNGFGR